MEIIIGIVVAVAVIFMFLPSRKDTDIMKRLEVLDKNETESLDLPDERLKESFFKRIIIPMLKSLSSIFARKQEDGKKKTQKDQVRKELSQAGWPGNLSVEEFTTLKMLIIFVSMGISLLLFIFLRVQPALKIMISGIFVILAVLIPRLYVQRKIKERKHTIVKKLPDVLDLLTVSVEAGLGFDSALQKVVDKFSGPIAEEFKIVLSEVRLGRPRREALKALSEKMEVEDLSSFLSAIIQAEQLGVSIGNVLRIQSAQARMKRRQRAEAAAMKAPIKMMIPLVGCIFPTIMIVIMGSTVYRIYDQLISK